jgi:energy-coupling factor transporter ATP-binding protein EcfA2
MTTWPSGDRDTTEWPEVSISVETNYRRHLEDFMSIDGVDWSDFKQMDEKSAHAQTPQRWRSYRKMYERLGLIRKEGDKIVLTAFGKDTSTIEHRLSAQKASILEDLAHRASNTLVRYQFKNPTEDSADFRLLPGDCDMRPYYAIWKCMLQLDGKLHYQELNRVLLKVLYLKNIDAAIEKIRAARIACLGDYSKPESFNYDALLGEQTTTDQPSARMAAWFSLAGWGGLIIESAADANGFRNLTESGKKAVAKILEGKLPVFEGVSVDDWYEYYSAPGQIITQSSIFSGSNASSTLADMVKSFCTCCDDPLAGLKIKQPLAHRFASSLLSKRFLILTGLSGSGKTKLAQAFARWITPEPKYLNSDDPSEGKNPNTCVALVAVGADWTGNEHILGYPHGLDDKKYVTKQTLDLIIHASKEENNNTPHFLILDEMNLSHVERYFADLLSAIESDENIRLHFDDGRTEGAIPKEIKLPPNLFIIGTVNVDETTYMFSPKVLDRANVIEFRMDEGELEKFLVTPVKPNLEKLDGEGDSFGAAFVAAASNPTAVAADVETAYRAEMLLFFKVLQAYGCEFGYRVAHEAARFINFYKVLGNHPNDGSWFASAFDALIVQKFLPKLNGSEAKLRKPLWALAYLCSEARDWTSFATEELRLAEITRLAEVAIEKGASKSKEADSPTSITEKLRKDSKDPAYQLSFTKIERMWRAAQSNGFTSFAESI